MCAAGRDEGEEYDRGAEQKAALERAQDPFRAVRTPSCDARPSIRPSDRPLDHTTTLPHTHRFR